MSTNKKSEDFGTNSANTVIKPRKALLDLESPFFDFIRSEFAGMTSKKFLGAMLTMMAMMMVLWAIMALR